MSSEDVEQYDWTARLGEIVSEVVARRDRRREIREEFAASRAAGKSACHTRRLKESPMVLLIPDGARSARRCVVKGCERVPKRGTAICPVHSHALQRPPAQQQDPLAAAVDRVGAAFAALDSGARLRLAMELLRALQREDLPPALRSVGVALNHLTGNGSAENLAELVEVLRAAGADVQMAFAVIAGERAASDPARSEVWQALHDLVWTLSPEGSA